MAIPYRTTADGFEMQFGTNHLGHFALTGLLLPIILRTPKARIVTISSGLHHSGHINFDDLNPKANYNQNKAYSQSSWRFVVHLEFTIRHGVMLPSRRSGCRHYLQGVGPRERLGTTRTEMVVMNAVLAQSAAMGALPTLMAAGSPTIQGGDYIGPKGFQEMRGYPVVVKSNAESYSEPTAQRLWTVSEHLTGMQYEPQFQQQPAAAHA